VHGGLGWPPATRRTRDPRVELLYTLSDELAELWNAASRVDALRAAVNKVSSDQPVDLAGLSEAVNAAIGGDTPGLLDRLRQHAPQAAWHAAARAATDRRNAVTALRGLADTATLQARIGKPLPAWRATGPVDEAAELLHAAGRNLAAADAALAAALSSGSSSQ
jgi:hypothetical protein